MQYLIDLRNSTYDNQLVVYYSDQRDPLHGQKLAHQTSSDLVNWGPVVNDAAYTEYLARPGMTTVAYIPPLKKCPSNPTSLCPLSAVSGAVESIFAPELLPSLPKQEVIG